MGTAQRDILVRSILWSFLSEVLKDGEVDDQERAALQALVKLLGVEQTVFDEITREVRAELKANPAAGSLDSAVFLRRLSAQLKGAFSGERVQPILAKVAAVLGVDAASVEADSIAAAPAAAPEGTGRFRILDKEGVRYVEVALRGDAVRTEAGAMRYYRGDIEMESQTSGGGGLGGFFKAALSGETFHKPVYTGTGTLVLEPSFSNYFQIELEGEEMILDQGAYWASEMDVVISAYRNQAMNALMSGEGMFQTSAKGKGAVVVAAPGPIEVLDLKNELLVVDGSFAVARSASLSFQVSRSTKSLWGSMTSGEGLVNRISGTGRVYLAPVPNRNLLLKGMMGQIGMARAGR